jgi:hypothetical protein
MGQHRTRIRSEREAKKDKVMNLIAHTDHDMGSTKEMGNSGSMCVEKASGMLTVKLLRMLVEPV